jgi:hypothetical protein
LDKVVSGLFQGAATYRGFPAHSSADAKPSTTPGSHPEGHLARFAAEWMEC